ncbi:MAG: hypothetical protein CSA01_00400 [Bacteroidetes bacterium]|nr:MAG: hypothetical protein CSA01_00400 [Bacteroidota bacterium]
MVKFFKKYHKWIGIIITLFMLFFAVSGIVLNHRQLFASLDVPRQYLPDNYSYNNWDLGSVKKVTHINKDSCLVYGNIGVWLSDKNLSQFTDFSRGFPKGIDHKKISKIHQTKKGQLFAGTLFGLYRYNRDTQAWEQQPLPSVRDPRIVDITEKEDTLLVLSRSFVFSSTDGRQFKKHQLINPEGYDGKVSLFKTLWIIHSGEIYGNIGKLFVDGIALIFIFLTITGLILFINPYMVKKKKIKHKAIQKYQRSNRWNLKWHNRIGWTTIILLLITTITGMFLRPPLLIAIMSGKVKKIPYTILDDDNAWFDQLRVIHYNEATQNYIIGTIGGMYYAKDIFNDPPQLFKHDIPISVMGITVFEQKSAYEYLIGSFEGLFLWHTQTGEILDYITQKPYVAPTRKGPPIGNYLVSGYMNNYKSQEAFFDYHKGFCAIDGQPIPLPMPDDIAQQPVSLWNIMLEVHTARVFQPLIGFLYILIVPLVGLLTVFVLISGLVVWYKRHYKKHIRIGCLV